MDVREKLVELANDVLRYLPWGEIQKDTAERIADRMMDHGVTVQEWISVKDRLPEKDGIYLTFNKKKQYEFHLFQSGKRMWQGIWEEDGVTHWMPLPKPPKGE